MNNSKYTPGPWTVGGQKIVQDPRNGANIGTQVIETSLGEIELIDGTNEQDYNARLIAAAPELLHALIEMEKDLVDAMRMNNGLVGSVRQGTLGNAIQAINKAKGE